MILKVSALALVLLACAAPVKASGSGLESLAALSASCRPWAVVAYHLVSGAKVPERVWVMSDFSRAGVKATSLRAKGKTVAVEPAFGVRVFTAIVIHESGGHPWIIGDNGPPHRAYTFATKDEAVAKARELFSIGHQNLDLGLAQLNTGNLSGFGLNLETAFTPCTNIKAGGMILARSYYGAAEIAGYGATALEMSLRAYNTGKYYVGEAYAQSVWAIGRSLPASIGDERRVSLR